MKKQTLLLATVLFVTAMSITACGGSKGCKGKGGGWYGDRNLTYSPTSQSEVETTAKIEENNKACEDVNP